MGGYKVAYEYANHADRLGHEVTVVHSFGGWSNNRQFWSSSLRQVVRPRPPYDRLVPWFDFHPGVRLTLVPSLAGRWLPSADATVLTGWQTSKASVGAPKAGRFSQLVYDYEFWLTSSPILRRKIAAALSRSDIDYFATSAAVVQMLAAIGTTPVATVTAGLDHGLFKMAVPIADRPPVVLFPLRNEAHKGARDMIAAAGLIRAARPDVSIRCFGEARVDLPSWIERCGRVADSELASLYNAASVFILPSRAEGWGLPAAEAMACGAAVVVADNGGSADFAVNKETALVVPIGEPDALAEAALRLLEDEHLRSHLGAAGVERASRMTWEASTATLLEAVFAPIPRSVRCE